MRFAALQAAVDERRSAAATSLQQTAAMSAPSKRPRNIFGANFAYTRAVVLAGYGNPGGAFDRDLHYADSTAPDASHSGLGLREQLHHHGGTRPLQLQFARILTSGSTQVIAGSAAGSVNNMLYAPTLAALNQAGCGGAGGTAIQITGRVPWSGRRRRVERVDHGVKAEGQCGRRRVPRDANRRLPACLPKCYRARPLLMHLPDFAAR